MRSKPLNPTFDAIVNPVITKNTPDPGEVAVLVSSVSDLQPLKRDMAAGSKVMERKLFMGRHYLGTCGATRVSLVGPVMGAPYAVALLDTLVAWGVHKILFLGWCGSISPRVDIGDIIVPEQAFIDEGTSGHYGPVRGVARCPQGSLPAQLITALEHASRSTHRGAVWTTDAIYRETEEQVRRFQEKGALAVEMEVSALFSAARFRRIEIGCVLVTSDRLHDLVWQPGFRDRRFLESRESAAAAILQVLSNQQDSRDG